MRFGKISMAIIWMVLFPPITSAESWLQFQRWSSHSGAQSQDDITNPTLDWSFNLGGGSRSSPAVDADGKIYVGSGYLNSTQKFWIFNSSGSVLNSWSDSYSIGSSPLVDTATGKIFYQSDDGILRCRSTSGTFLWSYNAGGAYGCYSSPCKYGTDSKFCIATSFGVASFNFDGQMLWSYRTTSTTYSLSPSNSGSIFFAGGSDMYKLSANGYFWWSYRTAGSIYGSPSAPAMLYFGGGDSDRNIYCLHTGQIPLLLWSYKTGSRIEGCPAFDTSTLYVGSNDNRIYAFDDSYGKGQLLWTYRTGGRIDSQLTMSSWTKTVYCGVDSVNDTNLYAIRSNGSRLWSYRSGDGITSSAVLAQGNIYFTTYGGRLFALKQGISNTPTPTPTHTPTNLTFATGPSKSLF